MIREQVLGIVAMEPMGEYSANVKYEKLNIVTYNGSTYSALKDTLGNEPTNDEYWQLIAKKGDKGDTYELTDEDKENIKNDITENANSDFNKNVESKTNTFNDNVTEKTSSFNTNVENKTKEFNDNSTTKLEEFNTNSTNKLEEYNTNANAKLNEYNANADGLMTIAVDTRNELERVKNDVLETGEANGNYLTLNDSTMAELQELGVNSAEKQVTTTGVNKLDTTKLTTTKINGVDITVNKDGSITFNGTTEKAIWLELSNRDVNLPSGDYTWSLKPSYKLASGDYTIGIRDSSNVVKMYANFSEDVKNQTINEDLTNCFVAMYIATLTTFNNLTIYPMLVSGTYTKENIPQFEKYTGGMAGPSPDYPQDIPMITTDSVLKSVGSNLWNLNVKQDSRVKVNEDGTVTINGKGGFTLSIEPITLKAGKTYHAKFELISGSITGTKNVFLAYADISWWLSSGSFASHTPTKDIKRGGVWINADAIFDNATIRIWETEGERKDFEPYQETILNLPIPQGEFAGYINDNAKDRFRVSYNEEDGNYHLYLDKMLGKVVLDGSENIFYSVEQGDYYLFQINNTNVLKETPLISDKLPNKNNWGTSNNVEAIFNTFNHNGTVLQVKILSSRLNKVSVNGAKEFLSQNPIEVVYQLATPYTLDLGIVDMPLSYDGVTNIFVDTDLLMNINTKYYRNFTETIRNLQINNDTLKNELVNINNRLSSLEAAQASVVSESEVEE